MFCCIPLCECGSVHRRNIDKDGNEITFHKFPSESEKREKWAKAIQGSNQLHLKRIRITKNAVICNLHFHKDDFKPGFKTLYLLPNAVPSIFPNYQACSESTPERQNKKKSLGNVSSVQNYVASENVDDRENMEVIQKDNVSSGKECFTYRKLLKSMLRIKKPNQFWGVTPTDKFVIFSRWNNNYISEKRIVIENNLNIKVFLRELEINVMNLVQFACIEDVSALLEKVEGMKFWEGVLDNNHDT